MNLVDIKQLLKENGFTYTQTVIPDRGQFYREKGFPASNDNRAFILLSIPNPNHHTNIQLIFEDASANPDFCDLEFGGYWYELFDWDEEDLPQTLLAEMQRIVDGNTYVIFARKKGIHWSYSGVYYDFPDADIDSMDEFRNRVAKIKTPKSRWRRWIGGKDIYEIFNWTSYEKIVK